MARRTRLCAPEEPRADRFNDGKQADTQRDAGGEGKHTQVEADVGGEREGLRQHRCRDANEDIGDGHACSAAQEAESQALCEQLRDQAAAAGAECGANSQFPFTGRSSCEKQIGDVRAGDQQDQANSAECDVDRPLKIRTHKQTSEGFDHDGPFTIVEGRSFDQCSVDGLHSFTGTGYGSAGTKTPVDGEPMDVA
jgi:hypothetical protein